MPRQIPRLHPIRFAAYVLLGLLALGALTGLFIAFALPNYELFQVVQQEPAQ